MKKVFLIYVCVLLTGFISYFTAITNDSNNLADKVIESSVRIRLLEENDDTIGVATGTIIKAKKDENNFKLLILTANHAISKKMAIGFCKSKNGIIEYTGESKQIRIITVDTLNDLAIIEVICDKKYINTSDIMGEIYDGNINRIFRKRIFISSFPFGYGPFFSEGYISLSNFPLNDNRKSIVANVVANYGSSGSAIRLQEDGSIVGVVTTMIVQNGQVLDGAYICISYKDILKFLSDNKISL